MEEETQTNQEIQETKETPSLKSALQKITHSKIFDIILIIALMGVSVIFRNFSLEISHIPEEYRELFRDENGNPYQNDPDSYYYARRVRTIVETGNYSIKTSSSDDPLRVNINADKEEDSSFSLFPVLMAHIYNFISVFADVPFDSFITCVVPFLFSLSVIPVYVFIRRRTDSPLGASVGAFFAGASIAFIGRTAFACFDTDAILFFLPMTFICLFAETLLAKKRLPQILYFVSSIISLIILAMSWGAYGPYLYLTIAIAFALFFFSFFKTRDFLDTIKNPTIITAFIAAASYMLVCLLLDGGKNLTIFQTIADILAGQSSESTASGWPSAGQFVSELQALPLLNGGPLEVNSNGVINSFGGIFAFLAIIASLVWLLITYVRADYTMPGEEETDKTVLFTILFVWMMGGLVALFGGNRFTEIASLPASLVIGVGIGYLSKGLSSRGFGFTALILAGTVIGVPLIYLINGGITLTPTITDATVSASRFIAEDAGENADDSIIFSWWDYGYAYQYYSGVSTFADGGTYNGEVYYYLARMFMTDDPDESIEMIRTLLSRANLDKKYAYLVISQEMTRITTALSYYANWNSEEELKYEDSILYFASEKSGNIGKYKYLASFDDPSGMHSNRVYKIKLKD